MYTHGAHISSFNVVMTIYCASRSSQDHKLFKAAFCLNGSLIMRKHDIFMWEADWSGNRKTEYGISGEKYAFAGN